MLITQLLVTLDNLSQISLHQISHNIHIIELDKVARWNQISQANNLCVVVVVVVLTECVCH